MNANIIGVKEGVRLGAGNVPVKVLQVTWTAGTYGPFTAESTWAELNNGQLLADLNEKARQLGNLPVPASSV